MGATRAASHLLGSWNVGAKAQQGACVAPISQSPGGHTTGQHVVGLEGEGCVHGMRVGGGRGGRRTHPAVSSPKMMHMRRATLAGGPTTGTSCRSPWLWDGPGGTRWRSPVARAPRCEPGTRAVLWPLLVDSSMPGGWPPTRRRARKRQGKMEKGRGSTIHARPCPTMVGVQGIERGPDAHGRTQPISGGAPNGGYARGAWWLWLCLRSP
jgi:hypothetical protein